VDGRLETLEGVGLVVPGGRLSRHPIPGVRSTTTPDISRTWRACHCPEGSGAGEYVVGWAKRGRSGLVGTNRADSIVTVQAMLADLKEITASERRVDLRWRPLPDCWPRRGESLTSPMENTGQDRAGQRRGHGKVREKFTRVEDMLAALCMTTLRR